MPSKTTITSKKILIERIAKKTRFPKNQIEMVISTLLEETKKSLVKGEEIRLQGYFSFKTAITKPRMAMNLQTKKKMRVPAKRVPKCKFSSNLKEEIARKSPGGFIAPRAKVAYTRSTSGTTGLALRVAYGTVYQDISNALRMRRGWAAGVRPHAH